MNITSWEKAGAVLFIMAALNNKSVCIEVDDMDNNINNNPLLILEEK
jgi:hypothetical protein